MAHHEDSGAADHSPNTPGGGANVGTMSADPMASSRFPERELGQNATSYGGGPGPAAAPVGGRSNRTGASTGDKLVGEYLSAWAWLRARTSGAHASGLPGTRCLLRSDMGD